MYIHNIIFIIIQINNENIEEDLIIKDIKFNNKKFYGLYKEDKYKKDIKNKNQIKEKNILIKKIIKRIALEESILTKNEIKAQYNSNCTESNKLRFSKGAQTI